MAKKAMQYREARRQHATQVRNRCVRCGRPRPFSVQGPTMTTDLFVPLQAVDAPADDLALLNELDPVADGIGRGRREPMRGA